MASLVYERKNCVTDTGRRICPPGTFKPWGRLSAEAIQSPGSSSDLDSRFKQGVARAGCIRGRKAYG